MSAFETITPKNLVVANCLPLIEQIFLAQRKASLERYEYAKNYHNWKHYYEGIGGYLSHALNQFEKLGIDVVRELTFAQWKNIFLSGASAILLIAHWQDNHTGNGCCIEFSDGFVRIEQLIDFIPHDREMIIDLCVCHPTPFVTLIEEQRPKVRIVYKDVEVLPHLWLLIYLEAFSELAINPMDYATALEKALTHLIS